MPSILMKALVSGSAVSLATTAVLAVLAGVEDRDPVQPVNSTSHWVLGDKAGRSRAIDLRHNLLGYATHHAASVFWATVYEAVRQLRPQRAPLLDAVGVSAIAAAVDYGVVPKRLTPGWEKVVTPKSIAIAYAFMALALLATSAGRERERDRR